MSCVPMIRESKPLEKRASPARLAGKLKKRMSSGCSCAEGRNSFGVEGLVPLIAFAVELGLKHLPEREILAQVVEAYVGLYGEASVRVFLRENKGWLALALDTAFKVVLV